MPGHWPQEARWSRPIPGFSILTWAGQDVSSVTERSWLYTGSWGDQVHPFRELILPGIYLAFQGNLGTAETQPRQSLYPNPNPNYYFSTHTCTHTHTHTRSLWKYQKTNMTQVSAGVPRLRGHGEIVQNLQFQSLWKS